MWQKAVPVLLSAVLIAGMAAACGNNKNAANGGNTENQADGVATGGDNAGAGANPVNIHMFINMPEYTDAFKAFAEAYKKAKPNVTIELEIMQADYPSVLNSKIASGGLLDVFASSAGGEIDQYAKYSAT
jgi:raffinose/stachyose/melibiose transport system substrate-binding protein